VLLLFIAAVVGTASAQKINIMTVVWPD